ncbi:phage tail tape measure protein [Rhodopseudomonas telluris]|uniref:Phage tail tape measure protein n=1 Tax=Rhodopseudomonas telluris TaxID=644215 RepID=A0ABV6EZN7_9BRAD
MADDNLQLRATLTATDDMSPVLERVLKNLRKIESAAKRFNTTFNNFGKSGVASMEGFDRTTKAATANMRDFAWTTRSFSRSYASDWRKATESRLNDARRLYNSLGRMEADYRQQLERTAAVERRASRLNSALRRPALGNARLPIPSVRSIVVGGAVAGAGIASVIKKRIDTEAAEVRSQIFGDLSKGETAELRTSWADRAGIKFGTGTSKALDAATEGLKAGIAKQYAGEFGDLALKAQAGLDIPSADVAKLLGRLSTQMPWNQTRFSEVLNAVAVANNATAADGSEIVEAMRRSLSSLASTKMTPEQLAAINATNISLGVQPFKAGTFLSFLTSQIAGAESAHGQQAKDLGGAASALGFGSRSAMSKTMRADPVSAIQQMLDRLAKLPEAARTRVAKQIGGREWMDELLTMVLGRNKLKEVLQEINSKPDFLDKTFLQKIRSMAGRWASIQAALRLIWEKIGAGFEVAFDQVTEAIIALAERFNFETIKKHFSALLEGLRDGFELKSWADLVNTVADQLDAGPVAKWKAFATGFAEGIREAIATIKDAFKLAANAIGGSDDARSLGKTTARLASLFIALAVLSPIISAIASSINILAVSIMAFGVALKALGQSPIGLIVVGILGLAFAIKKSLDYISDRIFAAFVTLVDSIKSLVFQIINKLRAWAGLPPLSEGKRAGATGSWDEPHNGDKVKPEAQSLVREGRRAGEAFRKAAFIDPIGGLNRELFHNAALRGAGYGDYPVGPASIGNRTLYSGADLGTPSHLLRSASGKRLPKFGVASAGVIKRDKLPSFAGAGGVVGELNRAAYDRVFSGTALAGKYDQIVEAAKSNGIDPSLLAGVIAHETGRGRAVSGNNPGGVMDPATGYARKQQFVDLNSGINRTAEVVAKNFRKAGGNIDTMGRLYAPLGAANDPNGLNGNWPAGVKRFKNELGTGPTISSHVDAGLADRLGLRGKANFMNGQYGAPGQNLVQITTPSGKKAWVHAAAAESFQGFVNELESSGYKIKDFGGHSYRNKRGGGGLSQHAYGNAIDINRDQNPFTRGGLVTDMPQNVRDLAAKYGLSWGGDWKSVKDAMHFEWNGTQPWKDKNGPAGAVPPKDVVKNVPTQSAIRGDASLGLNGGTNPVSININGSNHDPESLAALVQRHIEEANNWRTHDTASEYT